MNLLPEEAKKVLPKLYHYEETKTPPVAVIKFFDPTGSWTWYAAEGQEEDDDFIFWGLVDGFEAEYGYFSLNELQHAKDGQRGLSALPIERDLYFHPTPLKELYDKAYAKR